MFRINTPTVRKPYLNHNQISFTIPRKIDIDDLIKKYPLKRPVIRDSLVYFVALIYRKSLTNTNDQIEKDDGYIRLKMGYLRNAFRHAREILDYLIGLGIIECNGIYKMGEASFGYRINKNYLDGEVQHYNLKDFRNYYRISKIIDLELHPDLLKMPYLSRPFDDRVISVEPEKAFKILNELKAKKIEGIKIDDAEYKRKINKVEYTINFQKERITRIINNDYTNSFNIDETSNRFHSLVTNLKKEVRPLLRLNGEETASWDLKNSQPFFFLLFFKNFFIANRENEKINLKKLDYKYHEYIINTSKQTVVDNPYMIPKYSKTLEKTDLSAKEFCKLCREGEVYDYYLDELNVTKDWSKSYREEMRKKLKKQFLCYLYDIERKGIDKSGVRKITKEYFPSVNSYIKFLKGYKANQLCKVKSLFKRKEEKNRPWIDVDEGFKKLAITLQKIESYIFLKCICKSLSELFPEMYFLTVHDSIIFPKSYKEQVKRVIQDTIFRLTDEMPRLSSD